MPDLPIVDPHFHLWDLSFGKHPWLAKRPLDRSIAGDLAPLAVSYLLEDYLADIKRQNVVKAVHIEAAWDPDDPVSETRWLQGVADRHGFPHGIVGRCRLHRPDAAQVLEGHAAHPNIRGIRQNLNWDKDPVRVMCERPDLLTDSAWREGFGRLNRHGFSFELQLYAGQMEDGARLARDFPDTQIILDHVGMPIDRDPEGLALWRRGMRLLAEAPNIAVKLSGLGMVDWHWTVDSLRPFILEAIDMFGLDRAMFASNFPVDKLYSSFDALYEAFKTIVAGFTEAERRKLFHDNAVRIYRL